MSELLESDLDVALEDEPKKKKKKSIELTPKQLAFIKEYVKTSNAAGAAKAVGYAPKSAANIGWRILSRPHVQAAIAEMRQEVVKSTGYDAKVAMKEAEKAMEFALETENANAYVKAVELRAKLNGLLVEKHDVRNLGLFNIQIAGIPGDGTEGSSS